MNAPSPLPLPIRAAAGLVARTLDDVRQLPTRLLSLPVLAAGTAMQVSLRLQQEYAALIARGDEVLLQLRGPDDDTPSWATFDAEDDIKTGTGTEDPGVVGMGALLPEGSVPDLAESSLRPPAEPAVVRPAVRPARSAPKASKAPKAPKARARPAPMGAQPSAFDLVADTVAGADLVADTSAETATDTATGTGTGTDTDAAGGSLFGDTRPAQAPPAAIDPGRTD